MSLIPAHTRAACRRRVSPALRYAFCTDHTVAFCRRLSRVSQNLVPPPFPSPPAPIPLLLCDPLSASALYGWGIVFAFSIAVAML